MKTINRTTPDTLGIGTQFSIKTKMLCYPYKFNEDNQVIMNHVELSTRFNITITSQLHHYQIGDSKSIKMLRFQTINGVEFLVEWSKFKPATIKQS